MQPSDPVVILMSGFFTFSVLRYYSPYLSAFSYRQKSLFFRYFGKFSDCWSRYSAKDLTSLLHNSKTCFGDLSPAANRPLNFQIIYMLKFSSFMAGYYYSLPPITCTSSRLLKHPVYSLYTYTLYHILALFLSPNWYLEE